MTILGFIFITFVFYLLFKLLFDFVLPIYRTTKQVKKSFRQMHQKIQGETPGTNSSKQETATKEPKKPIGDYIDYEEIKD